MFKTPHKFWIYFIAFIVTLFTSITLSAYPINNTDFLRFPNMELDESQVKKYTDLCNYHEKRAKKFLKMADDICWWMPDLEAREQGQCAIRAIMASIGGTTVVSKMVLSLLSLFESYAEAALGDWCALQDNLMEANYHLEMLEFYKEVLEKA